MKHKLRAGDALQLALALLVCGRAAVGCQFIALDAKLNDSAKHEGLEVPVLGCDIAGWLATLIPC